VTAGVSAGGSRRRSQPSAAPQPAPPRACHRRRPLARFLRQRVDLEEWLDDVVANTASQDLRVVTLSARLPVLGAGGPNPEFADGNPRLWLDVSLMVASLR
jgi:hypothetical protein